MPLNFISNLSQATIIPSPPDTPMRGSIEYAKTIPHPNQVAPILFESLSTTVGINVPVIGDATIAGAISGLAGATGNSQVSDAAAIAMYTASLPLSLFRRPQGLLIIGNEAATIVYNQFLAKLRSRKKFVLAESGDDLESSMKSFIFTGIGGAELAAVYGDREAATNIQNAKAAEIPVPDNKKNVLQDFYFPTYTVTRKTNPADDISSIADPMYGTTDPDADGVKDFVKVLFEDTRDNKKIYFRSYVSGISDRFNPTFTDIKYIGRPNALKLFSDTSRDIALTLIVPALSRGELRYIYDRLNSLSKLALPEGVGLIKGPVFKFTLGNYITNELCHLTNLTYDIDDSYPWEVNNELSDDVGELPHAIKVSLGIYIIGNTAMDSSKYAPFGTAIVNKV